ncbi:ABC-type transport system involved in cytochrome bd biosynthesis fused ATPase/permease subunit [Nesterenkonia sandarakina]|uniref:ABC-type transport system involved in cytochrome bd biosynthesis fused ATPase/permease subunit n=1 Tax=Nesterenkonia sandarakina TaxID=272918 RepID=A0A2T0YIV2_9MICC|nr:ABC-type transport system involved in cytochrome bd biosynthesis fused ATPase/permease subunit [Nesterenkonia sandarakina]
MIGGVLLQDMPPRAWITTALQWVRTIALTTLFLALGRVLDAALDEADTTGALILGAVAGAVAVTCSGIAAAVPPRLRAVEEQRWRGSGIRAALDRDPAAAASGASTGPARPTSPGHAAAVGGPPHGRTDGARPGAGPSGGRPGGGPPGGGRPGTGEADLLTGGVERIAEYRAEFLGPALAAFTAPALVLLMLGIFVDPVIAVVLLVLVLLVPVLVRFFLARFRGPTAAYRRLAGQATAKFQEVLRSLGGLVLLGAEDAGRRSVAEAAAALRVQAVALLKRSQLMILVNDALFSLVMITAAVALALWRFDGGMITAGGFLAVVLLATLLYEPIDKLGRSFYVAMAGRTQQGLFTQTLTTPTSTTSTTPSTTSPGAASADLPAAETPTETPTVTPSLTSDEPAPERAELLRLEDLGVERGGRSVLRGVTLSVPRGAAVAVVGPSGAGKSTLAAVLQGLFPAASGQLLLEGRPADSAALQQAAVTVPQKPFIFSGTVAENLRLARPEASEDQLWEALAQARLDAEIAAKPHGLDTQVGEDGGSLSGGQIRRLAIARALLSGAKLLILDEPTADLDRRAERLVDESLRSLAGDHTLVIIAHRLATTRWADQVLVLEAGSTAALGTPDELLAQTGYYAQATAGEGEDR